jgi:hypothetical protein
LTTTNCKLSHCSPFVSVKFFPVVGIVPVAETDGMLLELEVGRVLGKSAVMDSIWIESNLVELVESAT